MGHLYVDEKYLSLVSSQLPLFSKKDKHTYVHRCPFCGDSQKDKNKKRGYHFIHNGELVYKCHNCGKSCAFAAFLKEIDEQLFKQYTLESFRESRTGRARKLDLSKIKQPEPEAKPEAEKKTVDILGNIMSPVEELDEDHKAVKLLTERMIPKEYWNDIYFMDDIRNIKQLKDKYRDRFKRKEERLVIVYRGRENEILGITCRSFEPNAALRYISIPLKEDALQVYGLNRIDFSKPIYVVEGAFDSMFIDNCVAVSGANLKAVDRVIPKEQARLIYDVQPRNVQLMQQVFYAIQDNYSVVLLPETGYKDINLMVQSGTTVDKIMSMIEENTYKGLGARLKFKNWCKCKI